MIGLRTLERQKKEIALERNRYRHALEFIADVANVDSLTYRANETTRLKVIHARAAEEIKKGVNNAR